jgi:hypothetical protein
MRKKKCALKAIGEMNPVFDRNVPAPGLKQALLDLRREVASLLNR